MNVQDCRRILQVPAGASLDEVKAALAGYKAGTYGGEKKAMMERVVKPMSDADLEALATHVDSL